MPCRERHIHNLWRRFPRRKGEGGGKRRLPKRWKEEKPIFWQFFSKLCMNMEEIGLGVGVGGGGASSVNRGNEQV